MRHTNFVSILFLLVKECVDHLSSDEDEEKLVASLWGAERCLRVLESVSISMDNYVEKIVTEWVRDRQIFFMKYPKSLLC